MPKDILDWSQETRKQIQPVCKCFETSHNNLRRFFKRITLALIMLLILTLR